MCDFVSWIEYKDEIFFLTNDCLHTKEGKALKRYLGNQFREDIKGHGAIRRYFGIPKDKGMNMECTNFSSPKAFPNKIIEAIKDGSLSKICDIPPISILTQPARAEYEKIKQSAWAEYKKIEQPARAEYEKIKQSAWAEYEKIEQSTWAEYKKIEQPAWAEYEKIKQSAWAEYEKIEQPAFWELAINPRNRVRGWK
jgi:hypothetical protein